MRLTTFGMGLSLIVGLAACRSDEGVRAYGAADITWRLTELNGAAFAPRATIVFPKSGRVTGRAPCNSWSAPQTAPYPWFSLGPVVATKMACPDLSAETAFFEALKQMTISEVSGDVLVLSSEAGAEMVFTAEQGAAVRP